MSKVLFREKIFNKYKDKVPKVDEIIFTIDEIINNIDLSINILNELLYEIREFYFDNDYKYFGSTRDLNKKSYDIFYDNFKLLMDDHESEEIVITNSMNYLLYFIYNDDNKEKEITKTELSFIKMMISYMIYRFSEIKAELNNDEYMGRYKLKKKFAIFSKCYYDFYVGDNKVGWGWVRKKDTFLFKGIYLKIKKEYRRKKYGTKFYHLLCRETNSKVWNMIIKVNKNDLVANKFILSFINPYETMFSILGKNVYIVTLMVE